jgi:hypothetical protein
MGPRAGLEALWNCKSLATARNSNPARPACSSVTIPKTLMLRRCIRKVLVQISVALAAILIDSFMVFFSMSKRKSRQRFQIVHGRRLLKAHSNCKISTTERVHNYIFAFRLLILVPSTEIFISNISNLLIHSVEMDCESAHIKPIPTQDSREGHVCRP